jgi:hypothetical protein
MPSIFLDVHQATITVAVRDSAGKLVMEAILETKAETILQFLRGLRGSLHVTFEEGTWAAWLHDLLQPHVTRVVACDPRKNSLLKAGNKTNRIDTRKLSDLLYMNKVNPVYHGEQGIRTLKELGRSYITITSRFDPGHESAEGDLPRLGHSPCRPTGVCATLPSGVAGEDRGSRARRRAELYYQQLDVLAALPPGSATRALSGRPEASEHQVAATDSLDWPHPRPAVACAETDTEPIPDQKTVVGLLWLGFADLHQRGIPLRRWSTQTFQKDAGHPRTEH